jgi:signal transduction histidine kinase
MIIPIIKNDVLLGILCLNRRKIIENFCKTDLYKSNIFVSLTGLALDNAHLYKDLKNLKEELIRTNMELEESEKRALTTLSELKKAYEELKTKQEQLLQSAQLAALGRLVSDMAHEVNNPLMVVSGRAQLSLMEEIDNDEVKNNLKIIVEECQRAKDIIDRLLKFSRPSKGELKKIDVRDTIETVVNLLEHPYSLGGIVIKRNYLEHHPFILVDEKQIQEVFMNLLNNARDAMPKGGVIEITTSLESNFLRIDFKDSGLGMTEEIMKRIFEPFFTTKQRGTGLGLSVCYGIIKAHNGELKFESEPEKGTTATILLPLER